MQSGCDNFASNLVSWCIQSPLFESDVPLRSTHLLLLQKLGKYAQLQNQVRICAFHFLAVFARLYLHLVCNLVVVTFPFASSDFPDIGRCNYFRNISLLIKLALYLVHHQLLLMQTHINGLNNPKHIHSDMRMQWTCV